MEPSGACAAVPCPAAHPARSPPCAPRPRLLQRLEHRRAYRRVVHAQAAACGPGRPGRTRRRAPARCPGAHPELAEQVRGAGVGVAGAVPLAEGGAAVAHVGIRGRRGLACREQVAQHQLSRRVGIAEDHRLQVRQVDAVARQSVGAGQAAADLDQADARAQPLRYVDRAHHRRSRSVSAPGWSATSCHCCWRRSRRARAPACARAPPAGTGEAGSTYQLQVPREPSSSTGPASLKSLPASGDGAQRWSSAAGTSGVVDTSANSARPLRSVAMVLTQGMPRVADGGGCRPRPGLPDMQPAVDRARVVAVGVAQGVGLLRGPRHAAARHRQHRAVDGVVEGVRAALEAAVRQLHVEGDRAGGHLVRRAVDRRWSGRLRPASVRTR